MASIPPTKNDQIIFGLRKCMNIQKRQDNDYWNRYNSHTNAFRYNSLEVANGWTTNTFSIFLVLLPFNRFICGHHFNHIIAADVVDYGEKTVSTFNQQRDYDVLVIGTDSGFHYDRLSIPSFACIPLNVRS